MCDGEGEVAFDFAATKVEDEDVEAEGDEGGEDDGPLWQTRQGETDDDGEKQNSRKDIG